LRNEEIQNFQTFKKAEKEDAVELEKGGKSIKT